MSLLHFTTGHKPPRRFAIIHDYPLLLSNNRRVGHIFQVISPSSWGTFNSMFAGSISFRFLRFDIWSVHAPLACYIYSYNICHYGLLPDDLILEFYSISIFVS